MISLVKKICKTALVGGLLVGTVAGGALLVAGPDRTEAVFEDISARVSSAIDSSLDDPRVLRSKLRDLERQYPRRIQKTRQELGKIQSDITQLQRDRAVSERVVEMADADLSVLEPAVKQAALRAAERGESARARLTSVVAGERTYTFQGASAKVRQIQNTRDAHAHRAEDVVHQLAYTRQQEAQFVELLTRLEAEHAQFSAQLEQLDRKVESIRRNDELIEIYEKRKRTLDECTNYNIASLDQFNGRVEMLLTQQAAELEELFATEEAYDYEDIARDELEREAQVQRTLDKLETGAR